MAVELAVAYVSLVPSAKGIQAKITQELEKPTTRVAETAGKKAGDKFGKGFSGGLTKTGRTAKGLQGALGGLVATAGGVAEIMKGNVLDGILQLEGGFGRAALGAAKFAKSVGLSAASFIASSAKVVAAHAAAVASTVAGWVLMGVQSLLAAAKIALAWVISMGPIALVIAAVVGAAVLIVKNWDTIKRFVTAAARAVVDFLKKHWPLIVAIVTGPLGLIVLAVVKNWDRIKAVFSAGVRFITGLWHSAWTSIRDFVATTVVRITNLVASLKSRIAKTLSGAAGWLIEAGKNIVRGLWRGVKDVWNDVVAWFKALPGKVLHALGIHSPPKWAVDAGRWIMRGVTKGLGLGVGSVMGFMGKLAGRFSGPLKSAWGGLTQFLSGDLNIGANIGGFIGLGERMAKAIGWTGGQFAALRQLWAGESGWNPDARNPSSGAYGIPQALPPGKMGPQAQASNKDRLSRAAAQIAWGLRYIRDRYGSPISALAQWNARTPHWYAKGAWETSDELARLHAGEMVLPAKIAQSVRAALSATPGHDPGRGRDGPAVMIGSVELHDDTDVDLFTRRLEFAVNRGRL
jgi:hypothetical protein